MCQPARPPALLLRPAEPADVERLSDLHGRAFGVDSWSAKSMRDEVEHSRISILYLLEHGDQLLSMFGCWHVLDDLYLATIAVEPRLQRRGLGELTLLAVLRLAQRLPVEIVRLDLRASNSAALELYRKHGFQRDGIRPRLYAQPVEDGVQMIRQVNNNPGDPAGSPRPARVVPARVAAVWPGELTLRWRDAAPEVWPPQLDRGTAI